MGCDGGTIPRRDELVKTKKKPEKKDRDSVRLYKWKHCAVSQSTLRSPIVACELGRLYTKEEIISRLLNKVDEPIIDHIRGLKDIKELRLTPNPSYREDIPKGDEYLDSQTAEYICPITSQEMNGKSRFSFILTCGCVMADRAFKEIKSEKCNICNQPFSMEDVIPLNPTEEEITGLLSAMEDRRAKAKALKKLNKESKRGATEIGTAKKKIKQDACSVASSSKCETSIVKGPASAILRTEEFRNVRDKKFSVGKNRANSEVYKSIFDTHKSAQGKPTSHWVTCNPQYF